MIPRNIERHLIANIAKIARLPNLTKFQTYKGKGKEGPRKGRKFRKSNKKYPCNLKRQSKKYRKNSMNNKLNTILDLEREKAKNSLKKAANFTNFAKETIIFLDI